MNKGHWLIVVAAGKGERVGLSYNKVFHLIAGRSVLNRCLDALARADCYEGAVLVLSESDLPHYEALTQKEGAHDLVKSVAIGGPTRQASVQSGIRALPSDLLTISVHDAARAFLPPAIAIETRDSATACGSGIAATLVTDTIKRADADNRAIETIDRSTLRAVQTPQAFRADWLIRAHEMAEKDSFISTDDAALVEHYIAPVQLCINELGQKNIKLTTMEDIAMMQQRLMGSIRIGQGYDVHRLVEGRDCILCGVNVPHELGLLGHSDADVATHALMDALLGACAMGDIGRHFPDTDAQYKGAPSIELLKAVIEKMTEMSFVPGNVDVTIVCEKPKLASYIDQMRECLAGAMGIHVGAVNVKATTTEKLGFAGRGEGIEAHAVATVMSVQ